MSSGIWAELVIWLLISAYWVTWIWNLMACMPNPHKDIWEIFKLNNFSYSFWLISSLCLFLFWVIYLDNIVLSFLTAIEMWIIIGIYLIMIPRKNAQIKKYKKAEKEFKQTCKKGHKY